MNHGKPAVFLMWLVLLVSSSPVFAQDTVRVRHNNYTTIFSVSKRYPVWVEWSTTKRELTCSVGAKRGDKFLPDPKLVDASNIDDDYKGSGFDRGHISPAADAKCNQSDMDESFYFTNMAPQYPGLNRGQWKMLEDRTRTLAVEKDSVHIRAGCVGDAGKIKRVTIPTYCWKVLQFSNTTEAYVFPNVSQRSVSFEMHRVPLDSVTKISGFRFNR